MPPVVIEFKNVTLRRGGAEILSALDLRVEAGETLALLGSSGSGKTTVLRLVNRLLEADGGSVAIEGRPASQWDPIALRRRIGYVIQEAGLFPHRDVERNVGLVPSLEGWPPERIRKRVAELLELVGLPPGEFAHRYPHQLSGGQRQRVGVARALAADPPILLMDEPFGALDPVTRGQIQTEFKQLQRRLNKTVLFVTHDLAEAFLLGTRIALIDKGRLLADGSPRQILESGAPEVERFLAPLQVAGLWRQPERSE